MIAHSRIGAGCLGILCACASVARPESAPRASVSTAGDVEIVFGECAIDRVALDASGIHLLVLLENGALELLDARSGEARFELRRASTDIAMVADLAFSPDGSRIAWCTAFESTSRAHLVDSARARDLLALSAPRGDQQSRVAFSADGTRLALGTYSGRTCVVDAIRPRASAWSAPRPGALRDLAFDPRDAQSLLAWSGDGARTSIVLRDLAGGVLTALELPGIEASACTPAGPLALAHVEVGSMALAVHDPQSGQVLATLERSMRTVTRAAFSADGRRLAIGGPDGSLELWDWRARRVVATREIEGFVFSGDGALLAGAAPRGQVVVLDAEDGAPIESIDVPDEAEITALAFDARGLRLAAGTAGGVVYVWRLAR